MERNADADALVANWWEFKKLSAGTRDERKALELGSPVAVARAAVQVDDQMEAGGRDALDLLAELIEAAPDGDDGVTVGTGPLEYLLHSHGDSLVEDVLRLSRISPMWRQALGNVWLERGHMSTENEDRLSPFVASISENI